MNSKSLVLSAVVSILTVAARGDTLAWFRFEELTGKTGDDLAIGTATFTDSADDGRVLQLQDFGRMPINPNGGLTSLGMKVDEAESERVLYTDGSKTSSLDNVRAVALKGGTKGNNGNNGSVLRILETEQTRLTPQTFTVEFLYRNTKQYPLPKGYMSFVGRPYKLAVVDGKETLSKGANCPAAFELVVNGGDTFQLRYTYIDATGTIKDTYYSSGVALTTAPPTDTLWHHYALTVDQSTHAFKLYVDGALSDTLTLLGDIYWGEWNETYHDILSWTFGGNYFGYGLSGSMDEIRLSNEALEPEDFLTLSYAGQEPVKEGESILYLPFDDPAGTSYATKLYSIAQPELNPPVDGVLEQAVNTWFQNQYVSFGTAGVGEIIQGVDEGITRGDNTGCLHFQVPSDATTSDFGYTPTSFKFADYGYSKLTIECFFRASAMNSTVRGGWPELMRFMRGDTSSQSLVCKFIPDGQLRICIGATDAVTTPYRLDDSRWHHLALTIDTTKKVFEYYVDYNVIGSGSYTSTFVLDENWKLSFGPRSKVKGFTADLDEFRISNGILSRDKMLATHAVPAFPAAVPVAASTKAWYRFEETDIGSGALSEGTVFYNRGDPSILPAEVVAIPRLADGSKTGTYYGPSSVAADGGYINEGVIAGGSNNRALKFSDSADGSLTGSMLRIGASSTHSLCLQTFTVEFFYQTGSGNNEKFNASNWTSFFANHCSAGGNKANSSFELRHCGNDAGTTTGNFTLMYSYKNAEGTEKRDVKVTGADWKIPTDGQRHHYAVTLDQATHACELFIDHKSKGSITLLGDILYAPNFNDGSGYNQHWYFGGNYYGFTRSGTFDEFRFSDKVLTPEEMLCTGSGPVDEGETIAYLPLDSDLSSFVGNNPYADDATLAANAAKFESGDAGFADGVKAFRVCNAPKGRGHNSATLALDGRSGHDCQVFYPLYAQNLGRFDYKKLTCEFFFKGTYAGTWEQIVGLKGDAGVSRWAFLLQHNDRHSVNFRTDTDKSQSAVTATVPDANIFDGKWHHIAVTIDGETVPGKTRFKCFFDYQQVGNAADVEGSATGAFFSETARLDFGNTTGCAGLKGQVDELRLSAGLLEPEEFLGMEGGFRIMVR